MAVDLKDIADKTIFAIRNYVDKRSVEPIHVLEQRMRDLEERLRALDGQKAHVGKYRPGMYMTKDM